MKLKLWHKWIGGAILFGAALWGGRFAVRPVDTTFLYVAEPVVRNADAIRRQISWVFGTLTNAPYQAQEIRELRIEKSVLDARVALLEEVRRENDELQRALGRESKNIQFVLARIIAYSPSALDDYLLIDGGSEAAVTIGMPVVAGEAIHIGTVVQVAVDSALVRLLSHPKEKIRVFMPESGVSSVAEGEGLGVLKIQVPASIPVREGEPVLSVGPPEFLIGYIEKVEKSDAGPFQILRTSYPLSLGDVRLVYVVRSN